MQPLIWKASAASECLAREEVSGGSLTLSDIPEIALVTVSDETYPEVLSALHALSAAVEHERTAASMAEYIAARKTGRTINCEIIDAWQFPAAKDR